jgi:hypothetical protein
MTGFKSERAQIFVLTALSLTMVLGFSGLVIDVGAWYRAKRQLQATADAAALAGAQALPDDPATARTWALDYANGNGGGLDPADISINSPKSDTITVQVKKSEEPFFSRIFRSDAAPIGATAAARRGSFTGWALDLSPWVIDKASVIFGQIITFKVAPGDQASSGNFGGVDLRVKEDSCDFGNGDSDYYALISRSEHSCLVSINGELPVEPGNKANTGRALDERGTIHNFDPNTILKTNANGTTDITNFDHPNVVVIPVIQAFHPGSSAPFIVKTLAWFIISEYTNKTVTGVFVHSGAPPAAKCPTAASSTASCPVGDYDPDGFGTFVVLVK